MRSEELTAALVLPVLTGLASLASLAIGVTMIIGALRMMRLRSYRWAMTASILALLPFSPASLLGIAIGIWSLVVLNRPNVRAAFAAGPVRNPPDTSVGQR